MQESLAPIHSCSCTATVNMDHIEEGGFHHYNITFANLTLFIAFISRLRVYIAEGQSFIVSVKVHVVDFAPSSNTTLLTESAILFNPVFIDSEELLQKMKSECIELLHLGCKLELDVVIAID